MLNIIDTVNCSAGMYWREGARLCQKQSVAGFSEQASIILKLRSCITFLSNPGWRHHGASPGNWLCANHGQIKQVDLKCEMHDCARMNTSAVVLNTRIL